MIENAFKSIQNKVKNIVNVIGNKPSFQVNGSNYYEDKLLAEGAYGYIYKVTDARTGKNFAMKRINIGSSKHLAQIKNEINLWKKIPRNKYICSLENYEIQEKEAFIIMELGTEGTLLNYINNHKQHFDEKEILSIIYNINAGLYSMHTLKPPIAHRDIKIENVLKFGKSYKLCDFGSASEYVFNPNDCDDKTKNEQFRTFETNTTLYYRPPEMIDRYSGYIVNEKVDVWSLGCILYTLMFKCQPFQEAEKLTIISGQYDLPKGAEELYSEKLLDLMRLMLTPDPSRRPRTIDLLKLLKNWDSVKYIKLSDEVMQIKNKQIRANQNLNTDLLGLNDFNNIQNKIKNKQSSSSNNYQQKQPVNNTQNLWDFTFTDQPNPSTNKTNNDEPVVNNPLSDNNPVVNNPLNDNLIQKKKSNDLFDFEFVDTNVPQQPVQQQKPNNNVNLFEESEFEEVKEEDENNKIYEVDNTKFQNVTASFSFRETSSKGENSQNIFDFFRKK